MFGCSDKKWTGHTKTEGCCSFHCQPAQCQHRKITIQRLQQRPKKMHEEVKRYAHLCMWSLRNYYETTYFQFCYLLSFSAFSILTLSLWYLDFSCWEVSLSCSDTWSKSETDLSFLQQVVHLMVKCFGAWHQSQRSSEGPNFTLKDLKVKQKALRLTAMLVFSLNLVPILKKFGSGPQTDSHLAESQHFPEHKRAHSAPWVCKNKTYSFHRWTFHSPISQ